MTDGGGEVAAPDAFDVEIMSVPFPDECACTSGTPLVSDGFGSPDGGCGGGLDLSDREPAGGGWLRSRCGCMTTSFSGVAALGEFGGSAARFERELVKAVSFES